MPARSPPDNLFAIETEAPTPPSPTRPGGALPVLVGRAKKDDLFDNAGEARLARRRGRQLRAMVRSSRLGGPAAVRDLLQLFDNSGRISTVNGKRGRSLHHVRTWFRIRCGTAAGARRRCLSGQAGLADTSIDGQTELIVNNTNPRGGITNKAGRVRVNGNVERDAFFLPNIDREDDLFQRVVRPHRRSARAAQRMTAAGIRLSPRRWDQMARSRTTSRQPDRPDRSSGWVSDDLRDFDVEAAQLEHAT